MASLTNAFKCEQKKNSEYNKFQLEVNNELNTFKNDIKLRLSKQCKDLTDSLADLAQQI